MEKGEGRWQVQIVGGRIRAMLWRNSGSRGMVFKGAGGKIRPLLASVLVHSKGQGPQNELRLCAWDEPWEFWTKGPAAPRPAEKQACLCRPHSTF